jgi:CheY-like chemotaxis protein
MKILYVEDTPVSVRAMQRIVEHLGYELVTAASAANGLELARQQPDLILVDVNLPDLDGLSLTRQMRSEQMQMPIIAITAHAITGYREKCLMAGCTDYITKPFTFKDMVELLRRYEIKALGF